MTCKKCGTEIAEKALVCYRCGTATVEAVVRPGQAPRRGSHVPVVAGLLALVLGALFMAQAAARQAPPAISWVMGGLAVIVAVYGLAVWTRRRR
jgi:hypothetical protein